MFTLQQRNILSGSCSSLPDIDISTLQPLTLVTPEAQIQGPTTLTFSFVETGVDGLSMVYMNGGDAPIVESMTVQSTDADAGTVTVQAAFPHDEYDMDGFMIAVVCNTTGPWELSEDVAAQAVYGPVTTEYAAA